MSEQKLELTKPLTHSLLGLGEIHGKAIGFICGMAVGIFAGVAIGMSVAQALKP